jgi:hypothetical protein
VQQRDVSEEIGGRRTEGRHGVTDENTVESPLAILVRPDNSVEALLAVKGGLARHASLLELPLDHAAVDHVVFCLREAKS